MKKISLLVGFCSLIGVSCFGAPVENKNKLLETVVSLNKIMPVDIDGKGACDSIIYEMEQNQVKFFCKCNPEYADIKEIKNSNDNAFESDFRNMLMQSDAVKIIPSLLDADAEMGFILYNPDSDKTHYVRFSVPQLEDMVASTTSKEDLYHRLIRRSVEESRNMCPKRMKYGVEMTNVYEKNNYIMYDISVDEDLFPISSFKSSKKEMRDLLEVNMFNDSAMVEFVKMVAEVGNGVIYNYVGKTSGERLPIVFNNGELRNLIQEHSQGKIIR